MNEAHPSYTKAMELISAGVSTGNVSMAMDGARIVLSDNSTLMLHLLKPIFNHTDPNFPLSLIRLIRNEYSPLDRSAIKFNSREVIDALRECSNRNRKAVGDEAEKTIAKITMAVDEARRKEDGKRDSWGPTRSNEITCIHICQRCSPGCPLNRMGSEPTAKRAAKLA